MSLENAFSKTRSMNLDLLPFIVLSTFFHLVTLLINSGPVQPLFEKETTYTFSGDTSPWQGGEKKDKKLKETSFFGAFFYRLLYLLSQGSCRVADLFML